MHSLVDSVEELYRHVDRLRYSPHVLPENVPPNWLQQILEIVSSRPVSSGEGHGQATPPDLALISSLGSRLDAMEKELMVVVKRFTQFTMVDIRVSALGCRDESTRQMLVACRNDLAEMGAKLATLEQVSNHIPPMRQKLVQNETRGPKV